MTLKETIAALGLTQEEAARKIGVNSSALSQWISGKRSMGERALINMAGALGVHFVGDANGITWHAPDTEGVMVVRKECGVFAPSHNHYSNTCNACLDESE